MYALQRAGNQALAALLSKPAEVRDDSGAARAAPALDVPRAGGQPLDAQTRARFEPRYGSNFGNVRVHSGAGDAARTRAAGARAATLGDNIAFAPGEYAPHTEQGRALIAHELAHVAQQRVAAGAPAPETALESEADAAARNVTAGANVNVANRASAGTPHFVRVRSRNRDFEVGDVVLNRTAATDILSHGNLLPSADQAHVLVHNRSQLGYEVNYTTPEDPFRWNHFKSIIDNEHLDINGVAATAQFNVHEVRPPNPPQVAQRTLYALGAGGITLPTLARQTAINPTQTIFVASTSTTRHQIYYDSTSGGRSLFGGNSLAHELFGHHFLAMTGAQSAHGASIGATPAVTDPFGQAYVGPVNDYITGFAGAETGIFQSPTLFVSTAFANQAMTDLAANGAAGLTRTGNQWAVTPAFERIWLILAQNYKALGFTHVPAAPPAATGTPATTAPPTPTGTTAPTAPPTTATPAAPPAATATPATTPTTTPATTAAASAPTRARIESAVTTWFATLTADQKWVFQRYLSSISVSPGGRPTELTNAIIPLLPAMPSIFSTP